MYNEHFGFHEDPFGVSPDPRFLYLGPVHHEAFAALLYGVKMRRGFLCLIGEPGTGKTTLLYALLERLQGHLKTVFLPGTDLTFKQRLQFILESLGASEAGGTVLSLTRQLQERLAEEWRADSNVVLIFDEAQGLTVREMEDIRLLTNFEVPQAKLLQVILVGQPQLRQKLALPELSQLRQRITVNVSLRPLTLGETAEYIEHRLRVADWNKPLHTLLSRPVIAAIYEASKGIPRLINAVCHNALLVAYAENKSRIEMAMIEEAAQELDLFEAPVSSVAAQPESVLPAALERETSDQQPTTSDQQYETWALPVAGDAILRHGELVITSDQRPATSDQLLEREKEAESVPRLSEEDLALELGREIELTLEMSESQRPATSDQRLEWPPVEVGEEALALDWVEEFQPAVDLGPPLDLLPEGSEEEFQPEVTRAVESVLEISQATEFVPEASEGLGVVQEALDLEEWVFEESEEAEPVPETHRVEKSVVVSEKPEPVVISREREKETAVAATPLPSLGRRWLPTHPIGPSLSQMLDELEGFAEARQSRPERRPTNGDRSTRSWKPEREMYETPGVPPAEAEFRPQGINGQQIRLSMETARASRRMTAWMALLFLVGLIAGIPIGIALKHYLPNLTPPDLRAVSQKGRPPAGVMSKQTPVSVLGGEEVKPKAIEPPLPVVQPAPTPALAAPGASLGRTKFRAVTVKKNDYLELILRREYGYVNPRLVRVVQKANPQVKNWDYLEVGQVLRLPLDPEENPSLSRQSP